MRTVHTFDSTGEAYDACQCREEIATNDILHVPNEQVVGLANTWPAAVTEEHGALHSWLPNVDPFLKVESYVTPADLASAEQAVALCRELGYVVADVFASRIRVHA